MKLPHRAEYKDFQSPLKKSAFQLRDFALQQNNFN